LNQTIIDLGHYESEYLFVELLEENLKIFFDGKILKEYGKAVFKMV
jgi:putative NIF3 family GTP cyclohydrolase 1 type 2